MKNHLPRKPVERIVILLILALACFVVSMLFAIENLLWIGTAL